MADEAPNLHTMVDSLALEPAQPKPRPRLVWADAEGHHDRVLDGPVTIGSATDVGIAIADRAVSRVHAELVPKGDGLWVRDVGSRNGTYVSGVKVIEARVPNGGVLRVGTTDVTVTYAAPEAPDTLWPERRFGALLGRTAVMRELFVQMDKMARSTASILVTGETGTGKEVIARALHDASPRAAAPFVVVDCAALPPNLLESELFGHARGAFTGAVNAHVGAFEAADGGTIFLDEVGELPLTLQPKLLRVLESRTLRRVGETTYKKIDVRVLSATHRDLRTMVNQGAFREDLFFRLSVLPLRVPPLRERIADLPLLLESFLGARAKEIGPDVLATLMKLPWTGNVRELRNFAERLLAVGAERAVAMATPVEVGANESAPGAPISATPPASGAQSTPSAAAAPAAAPETGSITNVDATGSTVTVRGPEGWFEKGYKEFRDRWADTGDREYLTRLMDRTGRSTVQAAREAGVDRTYLYRLLKRHDM
ncbi:MAG: sigma 54-interacting transcriptional regulator [Deltaproteobacteria bacterium]|nr:sigma 54-interacting transcriptional regulator [Deltaproteobacteria bacterium]